MEDNKDFKQELNQNNPEFVTLQEFFGENFVEEPDFIGETLGIDKELVQKVLDGVDAFMEFAQGKEEYIVEEIDEDGLPVKAISGDKLMEYVSEQTGITIEMIDQILDCEVDYFAQFGLAD